jgi:hypothetical protein
MECEPAAPVELVELGNEIPAPAAEGLVWHCRSEQTHHPRKEGRTEAERSVCDSERTDDSPELAQHTCPVLH